jgi:hypothetical protein
MNIDNSYVLDKVIESLMLAIVAHLLIRFDYTYFLILLVATFVTLILLDVLLGKVSYSQAVAPIINVQLPVSTTKTKVAPSSQEQKGGTLSLPEAAPLTRTPLPDARYQGPGKKVSFCGDKNRPKMVPTFYDLKSKTDIIEPMDDPVAKLYYSQNRLPPTINMEGLYNRQFDLSSKDCRPKPKCAKTTPIDPCLRLQTLGQERSLFESDRQGNEQKGGSSISFEDRYRQSVTGNPSNVQPEAPICECSPPCRPSCLHARGPNWKVSSLKSTAKPLEVTPAWLFGTYHSHLDQGGKHSFKAAPYCHESPVIECEVNPEPLLGDHLEPQCAIGDPSCLPCDLTEVPLDFAKPLTDTIIKDDFYRECRKEIERRSDQKPVKCAKKTVVQPHYVKSYPKYIMTRKNLAVKSPIPVK